MTTRPGTVIVGASIAGITTAESLRRAGYDGAITVVGEEPHHPYTRPPLSKQVLTGQWAPADASATTTTDGVELILGTRATGLDTGRRLLLTADGELPYDSLVIATGVSARRPAVAGVHTLRTLDDATALTGALDGASRALVIGAGILGAEIAAGLSKRGLAVTLAGRHRELRFGTVGSLLSPQVVRLHRANGVRLRLGLDVVVLRGDGAVLSDGSELAADVVVTATGSRPNVGWLAGSALRIGDGVVCDPAGRAAPDVYAVGDVARWADASGGTSTRVEHQQHAIEQAHAVAATIATGVATAPGIVPFFWSELHGTRIQAYGRFDGANSLAVVAGDAADGRFVALAARDDVPVGVVGWNLPRAFRDVRARFTSTSAERQLVP
ncbi:NAD(P)/FAD-dependent oxidoreductase [Jiangella sp. DSM 45060]|uniref:NAD(P)/FAD-dependent oxidoreductase n=1 Tax=Jiangella sp. DSM 45060 TaxID=1798224 RepID=UPI00087C1D9D|nr:FAD/NAD(P)-binding oxidoreductase [Jiangella sp. DSM 45060]SDS54247.1 Reductase C-terminal [Jiangella sp. DSM 45060]